jgi:hypothetical protein
MSKDIKTVFPCSDWFFIYGPAKQPEVLRVAAWGQHEDGRLLGLLPGGPAERPMLEIPPMFVKGVYKHRDDLNEVEREQLRRVVSR